jgi:hypothetical protein
MTKCVLGYGLKQKLNDLAGEKTSSACEKFHIEKPVRLSIHVNTVQGVIDQRQRVDMYGEDSTVVHSVGLIVYTLAGSPAITPRAGYHVQSRAVSGRRKGAILEL